MSVVSILMLLLLNPAKLSACIRPSSSAVMDESDCKRRATRSTMKAAREGQRLLGLWAIRTAETLS
jgi:hypothetical protein